MMLEVAFAPFLGFLFCVLLVPLVRVGARRCGLVDRPDGRRKLHDRAIPLGGGLAIFLAGTLAILIVLPRLSERSQDESSSSVLPGLLIASVLICAVGVLDDYGKLRGKQKLLGQAIAAGIVIGYGVRVETIHLFDWSVDLGLVSVPFTLFILLGAINSLNLMDGMDGMLGTVGFIICVGFGVMALLGGKEMTACISFALAGALLGFLVFNLPPASIFLGDTGSMLIGLNVGVLAIQSCLKAPAAISLAAPMALLILPIFDTTAAILRRKLTGRSIYATDRGHLHHCLLRRGLTAPFVLLIVSSCCLMTVAGTLASLFLKNELLAVFSALVVVALLISTRLFGHSECRLIAHRLRGAVVSLCRTAPREARKTELRTQGTLAWEESWMAITACAPALNLSRVRFDVNAPSINEGYHAWWDREPGGVTEETCLWRAEIPLLVEGRVIGKLSVTGYRDEEFIGDKMNTLAKLVQEFEAAAFTLTSAAWPAPTAAVPAPSRLKRRTQAAAQGK